MRALAGIVGVAVGLVLAFRGLAPGGSQFERVAAIACGFLAAAFFVVLLFEGVEPARKVVPRARPRSVTIASVLAGIVVAPLALVSVGIFTISFLPALYLMLPFFIAWSIPSGETGERGHPTPLPPRHAYA